MNKNSFEEWIEGLDWDFNPPSDRTIQFIHEREQEIAKLLKDQPERLKERWEKINYTPEEIQLKLL